jgi:hypothetical protein
MPWSRSVREEIEAEFQALSAAQDPGSHHLLGQVFQSMPEKGFRIMTKKERESLARRDPAKLEATLAKKREAERKRRAQKRAAKVVPIREEAQTAPPAVAPDAGPALVLSVLLPEYQRLRQLFERMVDGLGLPPSLGGRAL